MSGIFGVIRPSGAADPTLLEQAARTAGYRGRPHIEMAGLAEMGVFVRDGQSPAVLKMENAMVVADARVDGTVDGSAAAALHEGNMPLLASVLQSLGPEGLEGVAGDFAVARYDHRSGELLLVRSACNFRPLYWSWSRRGIGFACDPGILIELGLASGELDRRAIVTSLLDGTVDEATGFAGVRRLMGGWWARFGRDGRAATGRWFRPERIRERRMSLGEAVDRTRETVLDATRSRGTGHRIAHLLSAGRDSGSVAIAMGQVGLRATCLTYRFDADDVVYEGDAARDLAVAAGHDWHEIPVSRHVRPEELLELPKLAGTPIGFQVPPPILTLRDAVAQLDATVLLDGQGGEPLFTATPVAVLDLIKRGHLSIAYSAARGFNRWWYEPYGKTLKWIVRALAPPSVMGARERARSRPPWLPFMPGRTLQPQYRSARDYVIRSLIGLDSNIEFFERVMQTIGVEYASPLLDMRVIRQAMETPIEFKVPAVKPKPVLADAF